MKDIGIGLLILVLAILAIIGGTFGYIALYSNAAPKYQAAQRKVFVETPSYVQGKIGHLAKIRAEWRTTKDPATKAALKELAQTEAAQIDRDQLPGDIRSWLEDL